VALWAENSAEVIANHLLATDVQAGIGGEDSSWLGNSDAGLAAGIRVSDATVLVSHSTISDLTSFTELAQAIRLDELTATHVTKLDHVIISDVSGADVEGETRCLWSAGANSLSKLQVSNSNLHACGPEGSDGTNYQKNAAVLDGMMYVDPLFMDPNNGNYRLSSGSPLIDAGLSGMEACLDYELEPEPNGCALNLGYYGGTAEAATKAGADHCVCPVED
jgi:hypothetical protein